MLFLFATYLEARNLESDLQPAKQRGYLDFLMSKGLSFSVLVTFAANNKIVTCSTVCRRNVFHFRKSSFC